MEQVTVNVAGNMEHKLPVGKYFIIEAITGSVTIMQQINTIDEVMPGTPMEAGNAYKVVNTSESHVIKFTGNGTLSIWEPTEQEKLCQLF